MADYDYVTLDVFTKDRFTGNPLAVVMNAQGLSTEDMQTITREFNYSETTFVFPPEEASHAAKVRIFTPGHEMPFAGHPTVGTSIAIAAARGLEGEIRLELNAGVFPVTLDFSGEVPFARFQNPNDPAETGDAPSAAALEAALSLPAGSIDIDAHRPRLVGAGVNFVYARAPLAVVREARVNGSAFDAIGLDETIGIYLYAECEVGADADWHARMFAPNGSIEEDPATGSAAAAFPQQIVLAGELPDGAHSLTIEQGVEMGRPSEIAVAFEVDEGRACNVRIGGYAVPVMKGVLSV